MKPHKDLSRRSFLAWSGVVGSAAAILPACAPGTKTSDMPVAAGEIGRSDVDKTVWNACLANCQSRCPLQLQVKDGQVVRVLTDTTGSDELGDFQIRACVRGRAQRHRIYSPDRIKTPLRRKGARGEGEWEEISWEEAFDEIASEMKRVKETYGNEAFFYHYGSGSTGGNITKRGTWPRLLATYGGYLGYYSDYSTSQITAAYPYQYGEWTDSNSLEDAQNSKLQVMFGNNPLETRMSGGGELFVTQAVREKFRVKTIVIDPRYSDTASLVADEWIPLRPGTDAALVAGIAHVMLEENLHDQEFLDKYCVGFDEEHMPDGIPPNNSYRAYIEGKGEDGIEKTPEWASQITGVPAAKIRDLAREIAMAKPCAITQGWGAQRHANGENTSRAIFTLAAMTGNIGVSGGGTGAREGKYSIPLTSFPLGPNPVETQISNFNWPEAIDHGEEMTATHHGVRGKEKLDVGIKFLVANASNTLINQHSDIHHVQEILKDDSKCEFILVVDHQMTSSAEWADIVLPGTTNFEENDVIPGGSCGEMGWVIWGEKAIEPLYDSKTGYEMCTEIARRLGIEKEFTEGRTQEEWRTWIFDQTKTEVPEFPSETKLSELGVWRKKNPNGFTIPLKDFREDPEANPIPTPSGKIEIFSETLWEMKKTWTFDDPRDKITMVPEYVEMWEGPEEALAPDAKYPLHCIGHHFKGRTHSSYANVDWLRDDAHPQVLWINPMDAQARGIENDDLVLVYNDRGRVRIPARVTPRIAPGVTSLPQGAWYKTDEDGVDIGGCINTLTKYHPTVLAKGNPSHTVLVQVEKA
ncbi:MAG: DMSO/selenate family reductase complex A subunit [Gleimia sp.]|jgi:anaerobic dimethyl sulfoxide reductase subunit A|nr:molybdopterin-dependent oxidoreductase [Acidobacteriota bacterium]